MNSAENKSSELLELLKNKLQNQIVSAELSLGDVVVRVERDRMADFFQLLKIDSELNFNLLLDIGGVDWMDARDERFEVVYHILSLSNLYRLRVKVAVPEASPEVPSLISLWEGANFMEREVWDMFGIKFTGHPDLRKILMYEEFKGHPLRKDYPVQGKQPRIALRHPEVRNTALDMKRPALVSINPKSKKAGRGKARGGPGDVRQI